MHRLKNACVDSTMSNFLQINYIKTEEKTFKVCKNFLETLHQSEVYSPSHTTLSYSDCLTYNPMNETILWMFNLSIRLLRLQKWEVHFRTSFSIRPVEASEKFMKASNIKGNWSYYSLYIPPVCLHNINAHVALEAEHGAMDIGNIRTISMCLDHRFEEGFMEGKEKVERKS